jgi:two-component system sensor histidine kinase/response regulator
MDDHLAKPIEPEELWKALLKWIKPRHSAEAFTRVEPPSSARAGLPVGIDGLDVTGGLRRLRGNSALYMAMLGRFVRGQRYAIPAILTALEGNDWEGAERRAHTPKGVSGNIGATGLQRQARELEAAIQQREPRGAVNVCLAQLKQPLDALIAQLEQTLPEEEVRTAVRVDSDNLKAVCNKLDEMLSDDDAKAVAMFDANAGLLSAAFPNHYRMIEHSIRAFDFAAVLKTLRAASEMHRQKEST